MKQWLLTVLIGGVVSGGAAGCCGDSEARGRRLDRDTYADDWASRGRAEADTRELARELSELNEVLGALDKEATALEQRLAAARTKAERKQVAAAREEVQRTQAEAKARLNKVRAGIRLKCPPNQPLC